MKQLKKLTRELKEAVYAYNPNPKDRMLIKDDRSVYVTIARKESKTTKIIDRYAKPKKERKAI